MVEDEREKEEVSADVPSASPDVPSVEGKEGKEEEEVDETTEPKEEGIEEVIEEEVEEQQLEDFSKFVSRDRIVEVAPNAPRAMESSTPIQNLEQDMSNIIESKKEDLSENTFVNYETSGDPSYQPIVEIGTGVGVRERREIVSLGDERERGGINFKNPEVRRGVGEDEKYESRISTEKKEEKRKLPWER